MKRFLLLFLLCAAPALAQSADPYDPQADKALPPFCNIYLASTGTIKGSPSYVRLAFIAESLASAQESAETLNKEIEDIKNAKSLTDLLEIQAEASSEASGHLRCAADIAFSYKPIDKDDANLRFLLVAAFKQEAQAVIDITASEKRRLIRTDAVTPAVASTDAEEISKIHESQRDAASTIMEGTTYALLLAAAPSPDKTTTSWLSMNCSERADLLQRVDATSSGIKTAYSQNAGIIKVAITQHRCSNGGL